jgi:RNA polymerase sigma-70 factor, ECF subfamily
MADDSLETVFKTWLDQHGAIVLKVARAYTHSDEDRQDLAQEILLQVWRSAPRFEGRASASTWVYRVALNTALGWRRKERRRQAHQRPLREVREPPTAGLDGAGQLSEREMVERLYAAIGQLPRADVALVLLYLDGLNYRQMAEVLGISETNVGVRLNRAKKALLAMLNHEPR